MSIMWVNHKLKFLLLILVRAFGRHSVDILAAENCYNCNNSDTFFIA
jgi:hypothetical protein